MSAMLKVLSPFHAARHLVTALEGGLIRASDLHWRLRNDRRAVTALEYGLIAALIAAVIVTVLTSLGTNMNVMFNKVSTSIKNAGSH